MAIGTGQAAQQQQLTLKIQELWSEVVKSVNVILDADRVFGFTKIEFSINPKLEDILHGLGIIEAALSIFMDSGLLDTDETKQVLNSKQCVWLIRMLNTALQSKDENEYNKAVKLLDSQMKY